VEKLGHLDILVNNAGWTQRVPHDDLEGLTEAIWDRALGVNLKGPFYCVRAAVPAMRQRGGGCVINIGTVAAFTGAGSSIAYAASKAGLTTMTRSLARALAPTIRVNAVAPGYVWTGFGNWPASLKEKVQQTTPLKRLATVDDVAAASLYLATDVALTGQVIVVDGGLTTLGAGA
jgi:3-oxoacyl-[acyl-carrier protein] reductase